MTGAFELLDCIYNFDIPANKGKVINVGICVDQTFVGSILIEIENDIEPEFPPTEGTQR